MSLSEQFNIYFFVRKRDEVGKSEPALKSLLKALVHMLKLVTEVKMTVESTTKLDTVN